MRQVGDDEAPEGKGVIRSEEREAAASVVRELLAGDPETSAQFEATLAAAALWLRERARTKRIPNGALIEVDGTTGVVTVLEI
ncbi:hypothetical protein [Rhodococcus koreensis]|uniref:hypothetical protein n=1 Tax=Rhodococcus koreensis TaxID=99653 RepID=UPI00366C5EC6